jgi:hypothetical protein
MDASKRVKSTLALLVLALGSAAFFAGRGSAGSVPSVNPLIYSGTLEDAAGARISGKRNLEVKLWSNKSKVLCTTSSKPVELVNGRFSIVLPPDCVDAVNKEQDPEVEVFVGGGTLGRTKLAAVPYALQAGHATTSQRATTADTAMTAVSASGELGEKVTALESSSVSVDRFAWGYINCQPLSNLAQDGGTNILIRASLWRDAECTLSANDPHECHEFCASHHFTLRSAESSGCCGVATYYTNGIVETLVINPLTNH